MHGANQAFIITSMIETLQLTNFILVDHISIDFESGLNVITGETGAGKSLIVKSLELLLGQQASEDFIRPRSESALIEAVFRSRESFK